MPQYNVKVYEVYSYVLVVEADSKEAALQKAEQLINTEDHPADEYEYTLDSEEWDVWKGSAVV